MKKEVARFQKLALKYAPLVADINLGPKGDAVWPKLVEAKLSARMSGASLRELEDFLREAIYKAQVEFRAKKAQVEFRAKKAVKS